MSKSTRNELGRPPAGVPCQVLNAKNDELEAEMTKGVDEFAKTGSY